jgi:hypothetical protein
MPSLAEIRASWSGDLQAGHRRYHFAAARLLDLVMDGLRAGAVMR